MKRQVRNWVSAMAVTATAATGVVMGASVATAFAAPASVTIAETGSSLLYPLFNGYWVPAYSKLRPWVHITSASTGSGTGISQSIAGTVQIGASDAYLANSQMQQSPNMLNIPLAISAQQIMYNLPGLKKNKHLKLTGNVIALIYEGKITKWNDHRIAALNKGIKLPNKPITPVHRADGSGDTFLFTQFMSDTNKVWNKTVSYSTTVSWPSLSTGVGATGNDGVVATMQKTPYSIGYVGISWLDKAVADGLGYAALQNRAHKFVLPTPKTIQAAASVEAKKTPKDERISLIYAPGKASYPIINFEYAIVNKQQSANDVTPLKQFLLWAINNKWGGNTPKYLKPVHFLPLPANIKPLSEKQINELSSK